jgi:hypothetical protein
LPEARTATRAAVSSPVEALIAKRPPALSISRPL